MSLIESRVDIRSEAFQANRAHWREKVSALREAVAKVKQGGGERARQRHLDRGKLLPRERLDALLDDGAPFLELSQLAAHGVYEDDVPAAGIITGIGRVSGQESHKCQYSDTAISLFVVQK